ncbi:MAG: IS1595 family transposase, partial [Burkholderia sp.]
LGVSYKTVWLIKHKLLETMWLREERRRLDERVEVDDAYLGGECSGGKAVGVAAPGKTPFVAAVQTI